MGKYFFASYVLVLFRVFLRFCKKKNRSMWFCCQGKDMGKEHTSDNCCWLWIINHPNTTLMKMPESMHSGLHTYVSHWKCIECCLCVSCRGTALWPLSRFLAVAQCSPFPLVPWERLPLPLLWQSQRPDCSLCDLPVWAIPAYRWVTTHEATGLDLFHLCKHSGC